MTGGAAGGAMTGGAITGGAAGGTGGVITGGAGGATGGGATGGGGGAAPDMAVDRAQMPEAMPDLPPDQAGPRKALLVVGDPANPSAGDARLKAMIEVKGFTVTLGDDGANVSAANGMDLVVLSSSAVAGTLAGKYRDVAVPVLDLEASVFDDMKMTGGTGGTDYDEQDGRTITIVAGMETHPLAAGLSGTLTISDGGGNDCCGVNWGKPAAAGVKVANYQNVAAKTAIFAYEKGVKMVDDLTAPARRVGFFASDESVPRLTANALVLFAAAVEWAAASPR